MDDYNHQPMVSIVIWNHWRDGVADDYDDDDDYDDNLYDDNDADDALPGNEQDRGGQVGASCSPWGGDWHQIYTVL